MALFAAFAGAAAAAPGFPYGCFAREYTDAHLARHPQQSVRRILLFGGPNDDPGDRAGFAFLSIDVEFAAQGIGAEGAIPDARYGQVFRCYPGPEHTEALAAWIEPGKVLCHAECDGGTVQIADFDGRVLDLRTAGFAVEPVEGDGGCGGAWLTAEGSASVLFRLSKADPVACEEDP